MKAGTRALGIAAAITGAARMGVRVSTSAGNTAARWPPHAAEATVAIMMERDTGA